MGWCHSYVSSLPQPFLLSIPGDTTWSSFLYPIVLHFILANSCPTKPHLRAIHRYCSVFISFYCGLLIFISYGCFVFFFCLPGA